MTKINLHPTLGTKRLILRKIKEEDIDFIYRHFSSDAVSEYLVDNPPVASMEEAREIITWSHGNEAMTHNRWLIVLKSTHEPIGTIGFHKWDKRNKRAEIGYDLSPSYWKQGYMSEAIEEVLTFGREMMDLHRVEAQVHLENMPSYQLLKKHGFLVEGILRDHYYYQDQYHDHYLFSRLL